MSENGIFGRGRKQNSIFKLRPNVHIVSNQRAWTGSSLQVCCIWIHSSFCFTQQVCSIPIRLVGAVSQSGPRCFLTFTHQEEVARANCCFTVMSHSPLVVHKLTSMLRKHWFVVSQVAELLEQVAGRIKLVSEFLGIWIWNCVETMILNWTSKTFNFQPRLVFSPENDQIDVYWMVITEQHRYSSWGLDVLISGTSEVVNKFSVPHNCHTPPQSSFLQGSCL